MRLAEEVERLRYLLGLDRPVPPEEPPRYKRVEEHRDSDFDDYIRQRLTDEYDSESDGSVVILTPVDPVVKLEKNNADMTQFANDQRAISTEPVTLGMWHSHWEKKPKLGTNSLFVPSIVYANERWVVAKTPEGDAECKLQQIPIQRPAMGGPSNSGVAAYGPEETRPIKIMVCSQFMDVSGLPYVDVELYCHLKSNNMKAGTTAPSHARLHDLADRFLTRYRVDHYHPAIVMEIKHWTVLAAMLPTTSELKGVKMMSKKKVFKQMETLAQFKRDGVVYKPRWFGLLPDKKLQMYAPKPE